MTRFYAYVGGELHGEDHYSIDNPRRHPDQISYWLNAARDGRKHSEMGQLGNGCSLCQHWAVKQADIAFSPFDVDFLRGPEELGDIGPGFGVPMVSEKVRDVFERIAPGQHTFYAQPIFGPDGKPWTKQTFFSMVVGRQICTPFTDEKDAFAFKLPKASQKLLGGRANLGFLNWLAGSLDLDDLPPVFGMPLGFPLMWNQTVMDALLDAGAKGVDPIEHGMTRGEGRGACVIDFD